MWYEEVGMHILLCEAVHGRFGFSRVIVEQNGGQYHWGEERRVSRGPATPCHVRKRGGAVC